MAKSLRAKAKKLKAKIADIPEPKNILGLQARVKKLHGRIRKGEDRPNETTDQTVKRLTNKITRGKAKNPERLQKKIDKIKAGGKADEKEPMDEPMEEKKEKGKRSNPMVKNGGTTAFGNRNYRSYNGRKPTMPRIPAQR